LSDVIAPAPKTLVTVTANGLGFVTRTSAVPVAPGYNLPSSTQKRRR
jgi:hypothetical protein